MTALALLVRWIHLASSLALVGMAVLLLVAGRSDRPTARAWQLRVLALVRGLVLLVLASGVTGLACQVVAVTGRPAGALEPAAWLRLLLHSQFGTVWLLRHGVLLLLAALVLLRHREEGAADWAAWRVEIWALATAAAAAMAWAGHAAPLGLAATLVDALHAVAVGVWLGALLPLGLLLRQASAEAGADARPFAVIATRRFSALAFACMLVIVATGLWNAWVQVAGVPALIGTRYGWLLLGKLALLVPILVLAGMNRRRLLPALSGDGATLGRPAMARLSRLVRRECGLAVLVLGLTAALSLTAPGRHEAPWWPFAYRLSYEAMAEVPGVRTRLLLGGQLVVLGVLAGIVGALVPARRGLLVVAGAAAVAIGLGVALPPLAVDAYPTTYLRSSVPYQTASVTQGMALYAQNCATCHGPGGRGDGPGGAGLPRRPADLTAPHTAQHTAGDLFWWLTRGIPAAGMPAFADRLSGEQRWDLINFLRALSAAERARRLSPVVEPGRAWLAAPDFSFSVGPTPARTLRDLRGRWLALVVLFSLPESRPRLARLAEAYSGLQFAGAEIIAVPVDDERAIITRIGATRPPVLYPVVTEGASEIVPAYALLAQPAGRGFRAAPPPRHAEFLVDRQGYVRARWIPGSPGRGWDDLDALREQVRLLDREAPSALPPDEHVH